MPDEATMLAAYAASYPDDTDRLILADWLEERGDVRGTWLRDPDLARIVGPHLDNPCHGLIDQLASDDPRIQKSALTALAKLGEQAAPALPAILALLSEDREEIRVAAITTLGRLGTAADAALLAADREQNESDYQDHRALHAEIVKLGPQAQAVRVLIEGLRSWDEAISASAATSLIALGPEVSDRVLQGVAGTDPELVHNFFWVLNDLPEADARLLTVALDLTRDEISRSWAIQALTFPYRLGRRREDRDWLIPHLISLGTDASVRVAREAITALGTFLRERASSAIPVLVRLLDHEDADLRADAVNALAQMGPGARVALTKVQALRESGESVRLEEAAWRFDWMHGDRTALAETVRQGLRSGEASVRIEHLRQMSEMARYFPDLTDRLLDGLADPDDEVRQAACAVLANLRWPEDIPAVPFLRALLTRPEVEVRHAAIRNLMFDAARLGELLGDLLARLRIDPAPLARRAIVEVLHGPEEGYRDHVPNLKSGSIREALREALRDEDAEVRYIALRTLLNFGFQSLPPDFIPDLLELARTDHDQAGNEAIFCLFHQFNDPPGFRDLLRERLRFFPGRWEYQTICSLAQLGYIPSAEDVPVLLQALQHENAALAFSASTMLGRMGELILPELLPFLAPGHPAQVRGLAARALGDIGPPARVALPTLLEMIHSKEEFVVGEVLNALTTIAEQTELIEPLRPLFRHRHGQVRRTMLHIAARLPIAAQAWWPDLLHLTRTDGGTAWVLAAQVQEKPSLLPEVWALLDEPGPALTTAIQVLRQLNLLPNTGE